MLPPEVPDFPDLPAILRWEISLALVMLAWSLLSLGRHERLRRRWSRRRRVTSRKIILAPRATVSPSPRSRWDVGSRRQRLKVLAAGAGFASVAASVAYAMPTIVHLERPDVATRAARELEPRARPGDRAPRPPEIEPAPTDVPTASPTVSVASQKDATRAPQPSIAAELRVTAERPVTPEPSAGMSPTAPTPRPSPPAVGQTPESPEPTADPSPAPEVTPSPTPEVTPSPTPEVTESPRPDVTPSPSSAPVSATPSAQPSE